MTIAQPIAMSVVVVSFNTRDVLRSCLESVAAASPVETVLVDNGSTDGSVELVRSRFPDVRVIVTANNVGYGGAANIGIAACSTPAVLLLNSDTVVASDVLSALAGYLAEHPEVGVAGPRLLNADGTLQRSAYGRPSAADTLLGESGLHLVVRRIPWLREQFFRTWSHVSPRRVGWVLGAALAIRRSAFDAVGGFDASFFLYGEEVDLCRRLEDAGFEIHYAPCTAVTHLGGASTSRLGTAVRREFLISRKRYLLRHEPTRSAARILRVLRGVATGRLVRDALLLRLTDDQARKEVLRESVSSWRALLSDSTLWRV